MNRCFIFAAGNFFGLREVPDAADLIIVADAGLLNCRKAGVTLDLIVGDFDSMSQPEQEEGVIRVPVEKDDTDTMLALRLGLERGFREFIIYGGLGGSRPDHSLANLQSLLFLAERNAVGRLYDETYEFTVLKNGTLRIPQRLPWGIVSLFCFGKDAKGITTKGLQYPMENGTLSASFPLGVSNHILEKEAVITVTDGTLLLAIEWPPIKTK